MELVRVCRKAFGIVALVFACFLLAFECSAVFDPDGTRLAGKFLFLHHSCTFTCHGLTVISVLGLLGIAILLLMWRPTN